MSEQVIVGSRGLPRWGDWATRKSAWTLPLLVLAVAASSVGAAAEPSNVGPKVGDKASDFDLPIVGGDGYLSLSDETDQGHVVVVVLRGYPGYQCPICQRQVSALVNRASALAQNAHRVILVYPGEGASLERRAEQFKGSRKLPDPLVLVRDDDLKMIESWGLRWQARRETAYPSTFVIDRHGRIRWRKISSSHADRSTVEEIVRELKKLD